MKIYLIILFILVATITTLPCKAAFPVFNETLVVKKHEIVELNNVGQEDAETYRPSGKGAGWTALAFAAVGITATILLFAIVDPGMAMIAFLAGIGGTIAGGTAMKWARSDAKSIIGLSAGLALLVFGLISLFKYGLMGSKW